MVGDVRAISSKYLYAFKHYQRDNSFNVRRGAVIVSLLYLYIGTKTINWERAVCVRAITSAWPIERYKAATPGIEAQYYLGHADQLWGMWEFQEQIDKFKDENVEDRAVLLYSWKAIKFSYIVSLPNNVYTYTYTLIL